jgi:hypothetical protein
MVLIQVSSLGQVRRRPSTSFKIEKKNNIITLVLPKPEALSMLLSLGLRTERILCLYKNSVNRFVPAFSYPSNLQESLYLMSTRTQMETFSLTLQTTHSMCLIPISNTSLSFLIQHQSTHAQEKHFNLFLQINETSDKRCEDF